MSPGTTHRKVRRLFVGSAAVLLVLALPAGGLALSRGGWTTPFVRIVTTAVPYPVALVGGQAISYRDYATAVSGLTKFFSAQEGVDLNDPANRAVRDELTRNVLTRLVVDRLEQNLMPHFGVRVTREDWDAARTTLFGTDGERRDDVTTTLKTLYGWRLPTYEHLLLLPQLRRDRLATFVATDQRWNADAIARAQDLLRQARVPKADFAALAKRKSSGPTAATGGDLGVVAEKSLAPELAAAVQALPVGGISEVIPTSAGFHILKLESRTDASVHLRQILVPGQAFDPWLTEQAAKTPIWIFLHGFFWDDQAGAVRKK